MSRPTATPAIVIAAIAVFLTATAARSAQGAGLGRLFFTAEQRSRLERQRHDRGRPSASSDGATLSFDGIVRRSDGRTTVWINGVSQQAGPKLRISPSPHDPVLVTLGIDGGAPINLPVGTTLDLVTGKRSDGLAGGSITVHGEAR